MGKYINGTSGAEGKVRAAPGQEESRGAQSGALVAALEVLLVVVEAGLGLCVGVAHTGGVEALGDDGRAAEEDADGAALILTRLLRVDGINVRTTVLRTSF